MKIVLVTMTLITLVGCNSQSVHPFGGEIIFRSGERVPCSRITITKPMGLPDIASVKCEQPDGFMEFAGRDISTVKVFTK